jgi:hypothetical protein
MEISFDRLRAAPRSRRILSTATQPPLLAWAGPLGLTALAFIRMATLSAAPTFSPDPAPCRHREVSRELPLLASVVTVQLPRPMERPPAPAAQSLRVPAVPQPVMQEQRPALIGLPDTHWSWSARMGRCSGCSLSIPFPANHRFSSPTLPSAWNEDAPNASLRSMSKPRWGATCAGTCDPHHGHKERNVGLELDWHV